MRTPISPRRIAAILVALTLLVPVAALAAISPTGSGFQRLDTPPSTIAVGHLENNDAMLVFAERTNFALPSAVTVDFTEANTYASPSDLDPTTIAAGTVVNSYYVHVDQTDTVSRQGLTATITFPEPIIGVILTDARLNASRSVLGVSTTTYPGAPVNSAHGYELTGACPSSPRVANDQDCATLSNDRRTLTLDVTVYNITDDVRVLTQPELICALYDQTKSHKSGSTVPIKLQVCDAAGTNLSSAGIVVNATGLTRVDATASGQLDDSGSANSPDNNFRYDPTLGGTGGYIYNLSTNSLTTGTWRLNFTVDGISGYSVMFDVK